MLTTIKIEKLFAHPQNPRRDVGDVTELAESIKGQGLFQNLTVVKGGAGVPDGTDGYTVIIGHRRLAAAKLAGLDELPCAVAEMSPQEQVATMLLENMQRTDLTVFEQAEGFQMMLDLGETQKTIAEKTGFSAATVSKRLKLLSLNRDTVKATEDRVTSIDDYVRCTEIEDEKERDKVLQLIGTKDFEWKVSSAIENQKVAKLLAEIKAQLKAAGIKKEKESVRYSSQYDCHKDVNLRRYIDKERVELELPENTADWRYVEYCGGSWLAILKPAEKKKRTVKRKSPKEKAADEARKVLEDISERAYRLRKEFVANFGAVKSHADVIAAFLSEVSAMGHTNIHYGSFNAELLNRACGVDKSGYYLDKDAFMELYRKEPQRATLLLAYATSCDSERLLYFNYGYGENMPQHKENKMLNCIYRHLCSMGYQMSEEELQLQAGTHPMFGAEGKE